MRKTILLTITVMTLLLATLLSACGAPETTAPAPAAPPAAEEPPPAAEAPAAEEPVETEEPVEIAEPTEPAQPAEPAEAEPAAELTADRLIPEIRFVVPGANYDPIRYESGVLAANAWEQLGLQVNLEAFGDFSALAAVLQEPPHDDYHAFISGYVSRPERLDPDVLLYRPFHCSGVETGINYQGYCSEEFDEAVEAQRVEMDPESRREIVHRVQEILADDVPAVALYHVTEVHGYNSRLFSDVTPMMGQGLWNFWSLLSTTPVADQRTLRVGQAWDVDTLNPFAPTGGGNIESMRLVHDMLARVAPDGSAVPWAAESWEIIDDTTVEVRLREGMTFHDGEPVTASDVKFSYDVQHEQGAEIYKPFLDPIEEVEVVDDHTLVFHLHEPYPALFQATFAQILILPEHIWGEMASPIAEQPVENLIGSGPFRWDRWLVGEEIRLLAFEDHFNRPQVDGLTQVVYANPDAIFLGLVNEEVHMHDRRLLPTQIEELEFYDHLERVEQEDFGVYYVGYNMRMEPFNDVAFRQALTYMINFDAIVNTLLDGYAVPGQGFIAPANQFWHNPDQTMYEYDPERARQILEDAGYEWGPDGRLYMPAN
jgi:peptide/nickel transport system substrate-binding protein